ncbi:MAG: hypothetical protein LBI19_04895 [Oscillospiraceae bacterium]|jgi:predicted RNA-binding Zn-ribbon protein involved in translation (DUF1610 family)|nr:hypothetical protein [Oscillospiraceae bacterium]
MNPGLFTILNMIAAGMLAYFILAKINNWKMTMTTSKDEDARKWIVPPERTSVLRDLYIKFYKDLNVKAAFNAFSDLFYHTVLSDIQLLRKFGIRREMRFVVNEKRLESAEDTTQITATEGSLAFTDRDEFGEYWEQFVDTTTDQPLLQRHYAIATNSISFNRNPNRLAGETVYCAGCDTELTVDGEFFKCPNYGCGNTYTADSYNWMATNIAFYESDAAGNVIQRNLKTGGIAWTQIGGYIVSALLFGTMILGFIFGSNEWMRTWAYGFGLVFDVVTLIIVGLMVKRKGPSKKLIDHDPNCNPQRVIDRAGYLVSSAYAASELNPEHMKPFMDEGFFGQWRASLQYPEDRVINVKPSFYDDVITGFWKDKNRQYVKAISTFNVTTIDRNREVKERLEYIESVLCRNIGARYTNVKSAENLLCPNCGESINATADARCKYCREGYDVADFDWKLQSYKTIKGSAFTLLFSK